MSIDTVNDLPRRDRYVAIAAQDEFDYTFPIFTDSDLRVFVDDELQALDTDYTVAGAGDDTGGTITFVTPMAGGEIVIIHSQLAIERTSDYQQNGPWSSARTNDEFDRLVIVCQELRDRIERSFRWPLEVDVDSEDLELQPITNWYNKFVYVGADGTPEPATAVEVTALTQSTIGAALHPLSQKEQDATLVAADIANSWEYYGRSNRYSTLEKAVLACQGPNYELLLDGETHSIVATLDVDTPIVVRGVGCNTGVTAGSIIDNTTNDVPAIKVEGANNTAAQRCVFDHFGIVHEAPNHAAIQIRRGPYAQGRNVTINCNSLGKQGLLLGDQTLVNTTDLQTNSISAWQSCFENYRVDNAVVACFDVNSQGSTFEFRNCSPRTSVAGAHGYRISAPNCHIYGGQPGSTGAGGRPVYFYNRRNGFLRGGSVQDIIFEDVGVGEYAIDIDGVTNAFFDVTADRVRMQLDDNLGTLIRFGRAQNCLLLNPGVAAPTGGGYLAEFTANSVDCGVECDFQAARAPMVVNASATRPFKRITSRVNSTDVANISVYANLTTTILGGVVNSVPGWLHQHNGTAWNFWQVTLADDAASSFTPPTTRGRCKVYLNGGVTFFGAFAYDTDAGGAAVMEIEAGTDFEVTTGALAGGGGTDVKVTGSAHTDGKIYLSNRSGGSLNFVVLFESPPGP